MALVRKSFAYMRCSGLSQIHGDTWDRQQQAIERWAICHDVTITKFFREEGVTGKTDLEDRPALKELVNTIKDSGVTLVLIEKLDRLARFLMYQESILQDLRRKGIEVISVTEPDMCSDDPTRTLMRQVLGAFFQYERTMIVNKTKAARDRIRARGIRCEGPKPYGEHPMYPQEVPIAREIKKLHRQGLGYKKIANELNARGIRTRYDKAWTHIQVLRIIRGFPLRKSVPLQGVPDQILGDDTFGFGNESHNITLE